MAGLLGQVIGMKMETEENEFVEDREGLGIAAGINEALPEQANLLSSSATLHLHLHQCSLPADTHRAL